VAVTAQRGALTLTGGVDDLFFDRASTGLFPQLSIGCTF
jgi:hypothetical protein